MSTPFKMKGFSGFGNSPVKQKKDLKPYKFGDDAGQDDVDLTRKGPPYEPGMSKKEKEKARQVREKANRFEHNVEAKMDEYPPKYFHGDIKRKSPMQQKKKKETSLEKAKRGLGLTKEKIERDARLLKQKLKGKEDAQKKALKAYNKKYKSGN